MNTIDDSSEKAIHILKHKLALYESLSTGSGLTGILAEAEAYFNHPIFICDASYNFLGTSSLSKDMSYGMKYSNGKAYLDSPEVESLKRYRIIDSIYSSEESFVTVTPDHPTNPWIFCSIRVKNSVIGYLAISYNEGYPSIDDLDIATVTAHVISLELQKHELYTSKTGLRYEYLLTSILENHFSDVETIESRFKLLDKTLKQYFCLVIISLNETFDSRLFNKNQMETLRSIYPDSMTVSYKGKNILFINQDSPILFNDTRETALLDLLSRNKVKAGISQNFTNILDTYTYYEMSLSTLELGKHFFPDQLVYHSTDMIPYLLFNTYPSSQLSTLVHYQISELLRYDQEYNSELVITLKAFLSQNRNATETANYLHIHRSTFFYRIKKIEELLNTNLSNSKLMLHFELSFLVMDFMKSIPQHI